MVAGVEVEAETIGSAPAMDRELAREPVENPDRTWIEFGKVGRDQDLKKKNVKEEMAVMRWLSAAATSRNIEEIREREREWR